MARVIKLGEMPIVNTCNNNNQEQTDKPKTKEEIQSYVNNMSDNEKKEYLFFLVHKVTQEKEEVSKALDKFNEATKELAVIGEISNLSQMVSIYDDLIIPMVRGVYQSSNPIEEHEMRQLKKKIMGKLTLSHFEEYYNSKK